MSLGFGEKNRPNFASRRDVEPFLRLRSQEVIFRLSNFRKTRRTNFLRDFFPLPLHLLTRKVLRNFQSAEDMFLNYSHYDFRRRRGGEKIT